MFATFFHELKAAKVPVTLKEYLTLMEALQADLADRNVEHFYYLSRAALVKDERHLDKFDQVFGHVFKGLELMSEARRGADPRGVAALARPALSDRGGEGQDRGAGRLGKDHGGAEEAPRGAEGPPPGRQEMDRHRRHLALRRRRLQSRRRAHRPEDQPQQPRHQGVGQARVQGPRRQGRARHPQHQGRAAAPAQDSRARARPTNSISTTPSRAPRTRATSTSTCGPSGAIRSRC